MAHMADGIAHDSLEAGLHRAEKQAAFNAYADGVADMWVGLLFLAIAALFAVEATAPRGSALDQVSAIGLPVVVVIGLLAGRFAIPRVQAKVSVPRAGYVVLPDRTSRHGRAAAALLAAVVAAVAVVAVFAFPGSMRWLPLGQGLAVAGILALIGRAAGAPRFYLMAAFSAVVGLAVAAAALDDARASMVVFGAIGAAALVCGTVTFALFVRRSESELTS